LPSIRPDSWIYDLKVEEELMRPTRSDLQMVTMVFVMALALACGGAASDHAEPKNEEAAAPSTEAEAVSLMVPSGSVLSIEFREGLSSAESKAGDSFYATLSEPVYVGDQVAIGAGATISGKVLEVWPAAKAGGNAQLNVEFTGLELASGAQVLIDAAFYADGQSEGPAAIGAPVVGRANAEAAADTVIGAIAGTENGTAVAASTDGQEVSIPMGTTLKIQLGESVVLSADA
jgi:hypothetical protein